MIKYKRRLGLDMCVKCHRCTRPYYCQARMIEMRNRGLEPHPQRLLDVNLPHPTALVPEECLYAFSYVVDCHGCKPFKHYSSSFIETPLNSTEKNEEVSE